MRSLKYLGLQYYLLTFVPTTYDPTTFEPMIYISIIISTYSTFPALLRSLLKDTNLPFTVVVFVLGCALGILSTLVEEVSHYTLMADIDPHLMLHIFLPVLVFDSAFDLDTHTLMKSFPQVVILSVPAFSKSP